MPRVFEAALEADDVYVIHDLVELDLREELGAADEGRGGGELDEAVRTTSVVQVQ